MKSIQEVIVGIIGPAALAAAIGTAAAAFAGQPATLRRLPPLLPDVAALPRLAGGAAAQRINRVFAEADDGVRNQAADCRSMGKANSDFSRRVAVTMRGPRYLSVVATLSWYCGGAYPAGDVVPLVFDLASGARLDSLRLLPAALVDKTADYTSPGEGLVVSAALTALYVPAATVNAECRDALTHWYGGLAFMLWPDARADGIAIEPGNLPHVVKACGPEATIGIAELRRLGIEPALVDAIDEAHRRGWYDKRRD